jgi:NTP pyrophosphatase (non-canonical NTP hydrolase)
MSIIEIQTNLKDRQPLLEAAPRLNHLSVVVTGSYKRDSDGLSATIDRLRTAGCEVLSPTDTHFVTDVEGFVLAEHERHESPHVVEERHIEAMLAADFIWLHVPDGYVGLSGAFEIGTARAAGVPIYASRKVEDRGLRDYVNYVEDPTDAVTAVSEGRSSQPGAGVSALQSYYARIAARRGWATESISDSIGLLAGELDELRVAVSELASAPTVMRDPSGAVGEELADIQLYLVHIANVIGTDLASAVTEKERKNRQRFERVADNVGV